jgi:CheY-like chemotaxis protein
VTFVQKSPQDFHLFADVICMESKPIVCKTAPRTIRVLLVEDSPEAAELTRSQLGGGKDNPFQVEWKDSLQKAMIRLANPDIDVVLLDLGMPELSGCKTHLAITSVVGKTVPVVILTSDESAISRRHTIGQGAASYLVKRKTSAVELRRALHEASVLTKRLRVRGL